MDSVKKEKIKFLSICVFTLFVLMYAWPNFVHEPMHKLVLDAYNIDGYISFDFDYPIRPTTTHVEPISTLTQGLLFRLAPSIFSLIVLVVLYATRSKAGYVTHIILPVYLTFDLVINLLGYNFMYNDFSFFRVLNPLIPITLAILVGCIGAFVVMSSIKTAVKLYQLKCPNCGSTNLVNHQSPDEKLMDEEHWYCKDCKGDF